MISFPAQKLKIFTVSACLLQSTPSLLPHRTGVMMVTAVWYLSINNTHSFSKVSWDLESLMELLQTVLQQSEKICRWEETKRYPLFTGKPFLLYKMKEKSKARVCEVMNLFFWYHRGKVFQWIFSIKHKEVNFFLTQQHLRLYLNTKTDTGNDWKVLCRFTAV